MRSAFQPRKHGTHTTSLIPLIEHGEAEFGPACGTHRHERAKHTQAHAASIKALSARSSPKPKISSPAYISNIERPTMAKTRCASLRAFVAFLEKQARGQQTRCECVCSASTWTRPREGRTDGWQTNVLRRVAHTLPISFSRRNKPPVKLAASRR